MTYCAGRSGTRTRLGIAISRPRGWFATSVGRPTVSAGLVMPNDLLPQDLRLGQCQGCVSSRGRVHPRKQPTSSNSVPSPDQIGSTNAPLYSAQRTRYLKMWCWPLGSRKVSGRDLNSPQSMVRWRRLTGGRARPFDYVLAASIDINPSASYSQLGPTDRES